MNTRQRYPRTETIDTAQDVQLCLGFDDEIADPKCLIW